MKRRTMLVLLTSAMLVALSGCTPAYKNKEPNVRRAAVLKLTDPTLLTAIAFDDPDKGVCQTAVDRLAEIHALDQALAARLATEHKFDEVRLRVIVLYLEDLATLDKIVTNDKEGNVIRQLANNRLVKLTGVEKYELKVLKQ